MSEHPYTDAEGWRHSIPGNYHKHMPGFVIYIQVSGNSSYVSVIEWPPRQQGFRKGRVYIALEQPGLYNVVQTDETGGWESVPRFWLGVGVDHEGEARRWGEMIATEYRSR